MLALLPGLFLLLSIVHFLAFNEWRIAFTKGFIVTGLLVVGNSEALSLVNALSLAPLAAAWTLECGLILVAIWRERAVLAVRLRPPKLTACEFRVLAAVAPIVAIAVAVGVVAVVAPPNNYDSMTYHMARVAHWAADGTVAFYPTNIIRQLYSPPWLEYAVLQLQVLSTGDRLANLAQWSCMAGSVVIASLVAKQLRAPIRGQLMAAVAVVTLPMGILQASSTQTDYAVGLWLVCAVSMALDFVATPTLRRAFWFAASLGLALLSKGTAYVFAAPLVLLLAGWMLVRLRAGMLGPVMVMVIVPLLINAPSYIRNEAAFQNPLAPSSESAMFANQSFAPAAIASNVLRDAVLQFNTPSGSVNRLIEHAVVNVHTQLLHFDVNDSRMTWPGTTFSVSTQVFDEDFAGDPLQALLAIGAILVALALGRRAPLLSLYAGAILAAYLLFAAYLKWQPWHSRLELPLLLALAPLIGAVAARRLGVVALGVIGSVLIASAVPWVINNQTRPMAGYQFTGRTLPVGKTIFNTSRVDLYFIQNPQLEHPYVRAAEQARSTGCREIALWSDVNDWEYPLWFLTTDGLTRIDQVFVQNQSTRASHFGSQPCLLVVTVAQQPAYLQVDGIAFKEAWTENGVGVYERAG